MRHAPAIFLDVDRETRAVHLVEEYGRLSQSELQAATLRLQKKLGGLRTKELTQALARGEVFHVALKLLEYYDKTYAHAAEKRPRQRIHRLSGEITVDRVMQFAAEHV